MSIEEYFCTYCNDFLPQMEVVMACSHCGEYKGVIKVTKPEEDN